MDQPATPPTDADGPSLLADLRAEAVRLGFGRLGIAPAVPPPHHAAFERWLAAGRAGVMHDWLARHEPLRRDPTNLLPGARSVIVLATDYPADAEPAAAAGRGRVARYARGDDYHDLLRARANALGGWLETRLPGCRTRGVVDSAPLAERDYGLLAGLGWIGKNTMLIDPRAGSYFFLTAILTDLELPGDVPLETDHCGTCTACLDACPTGAFVEPRVLDATRCISTLTIEDHGPIPPALRAGMGDWVFGCDICQEVCPWNRHAPGSAEPAFQPRDDAVTLDLAALLQLDEAGFRRRFKGSPILRAKRRGLVRSAAIALGNRPDPTAFPALAAALADPEPVVREAAAWALGRWIAAGVLPERARAALVAAGLGGG
ncbi:MAG: tRNA epoxyqueuosine(34) reductase QueG [Planctomycetia bacterium]